MTKYLSSLKSLIPTALTTSKEKIASTVSLLSISETDYLIKTHTTDSNIISLLNSDYEIEQILGLKYVIALMLRDRDTSKYVFNVCKLFSKKSLFVGKLCLNIIERNSKSTNEILTLLVNQIDILLTRETNPLFRWNNIHMCIVLRYQSVRQSCFSMAIKTINDSNPLLRRISILAVLKFLQSPGGLAELNSEEHFLAYVKKALEDDNPLVFSAGVFMLTQINRRDYLEFRFPLRYSYFLKHLNSLGSFYAEVVIFYMVNFACFFLIGNQDNERYVSELTNTLIRISQYGKNSDFSVRLSSLYGLRQLWSMCISKKFNCKVLENFSDKTLHRSLVSFYMINETTKEKLLILDLIDSFLVTSNSSSSEVHLDLKLSEYWNTFRLNYLDSRSLCVSKLKILTKIATDRNIRQVLENIHSYIALPSSKNTESHVLQSLYTISKAGTSTRVVKASVVQKLIEFLSLKKQEIVNQTLGVIRKLIKELKEHTEHVLVFVLNAYTRDLSDRAKANILYIVIQNFELKPSLVLDFFLRNVLVNFPSESIQVKTQALNFIWLLITKIIQVTNISTETPELVKSCINTNRENCLRIVKYVIEESLIDTNIREHARYISSIYKKLARVEFKIEGNSLQSFNKILTKDHTKESNLEQCQEISVHPASSTSLFNQTHKLEKSSIFKYDDFTFSDESEEFKNVSMDIYIKHFTENKQEKPYARKPEGEYANISSKDYERTNPNVQNFNEMYGTKDDQLEEYKRQLQRDMEDFLKGPDSKAEEEEEAAEITYDYEAK